MVWAVALVAFAARSTTQAMFETLRNAAWLPVTFAVVLSALSIVNRGGLYRATHRAVGIDPDLAGMVRVSAAGYAMNKAVKTGGAAPLALFIRHGKHDGHVGGSVAAAYLLGGLGAQIGLGVVIIGACVTAAATGAWGPVWTGAAVGVGAYVVGAATVIAVGLRRRTVVQRAGRWGLRSLFRLSRGRFGSELSTADNVETIDDFFDALTIVASRPRSLLPAIGHAVFDKALGAAVLVCALRATGADVPVWAVPTVYVIALLASSMSFVSGGLGTVEASMGALLASRGVEPGVAAAGVLLFRLVDMWIPLLAGSLVARSLLPSLAEAAPADPSLARQSPGRPERLADALGDQTWSVADVIGAGSSGGDQLGGDPRLTGEGAVDRAFVGNLE